MDWTPHSDKQSRAVFSRAPVVVAATGIQWGKTAVGAIKAALAATTHRAETDNFLVVAPTYKILQQSTLPEFMRIMRGFGELNKSDMVFRVHGGGTFYFRTGTDPDSVVGITNVRFIWGDEAGLYTLYFWENLQARAAFREAQIVLTTSPYTLNWLYREIIRPKLLDATARPDVELVQAASWENPYMARGVIDRAREAMDPRRFNAMFGGQWVRMAGLVYDCFDDAENVCAPHTLPPGTTYVGGIDWGWTDPFVLKVRAITADGWHFGVAEHYRSGMTIAEIVTTVCQMVAVWNISTIYCGPDQPAHIEELNRTFRQQGLRCAAVAADNQKRMGIDRHYELLRTRRLKYFSGANNHTLDELETYHYPEPKDLKPDEDAKDVMPVEQNDHAMDADRYISIMTFGITARVAPRVPDERPAKVSDHQRLARITQKRRANGGTENW